MHEKEPQEPPEHTSEHVKSQIFPGGVPPDPPHTVHFIGPHFLYLPWAPPNPLGGPGYMCYTRYSSINFVLQ